MCQVVISGMPITISQIDLADLKIRLQNAVAGVLGLSDPRNDVSISFPADLLEEGLGEEIIANVCGLFDLPGRDDAMMYALNCVITGEITTMAKAKISQCKSVESFVTPKINPRHCFRIEVSEV